MTEAQQNSSSRKWTHRPTEPRRMTPVVLAVVCNLLLIDIAVETFISGSPLRLGVAGAAAIYLAATALVWRFTPAAWSRADWGTRAALSCGMLAGLFAATPWLSDGLTRGVTMLRLSTPTVLSIVLASGVALAGFVLVRLDRMPAVMKAVFAAMAVYGIAAFVQGAIAGTPLPALLAGQSLWRRAPFVLQGAFLGGLVLLPLALLASIATAGLRRPRAGSMRAAAYRGLAIATSVAIVASAAPLPGRVDGRSLARVSDALSPGVSLPLGMPARFPAGSASALDNSLRAIEDGERESPRDRWDPAYVVERLGSQPDRLFAWVRTNTFWVPYRGVLRGPVGVLMDRLGNSLDRAVLLATLFQRAGYTARLAHGTLAPDQARRLLPRLIAERALRSSATAPPTRARGDDLRTTAAYYRLDAAALVRTITERGDAAAGSQAALLTRVSDQTRRLAAALGPRSGSVDRRKQFDETTEILRDHWWVQRQQNGIWQDFDLLANGATPGQTLTSATETLDVGALSDALHHDIVVRVVAEQWAGGVLAERTALERSVRPSDLIGTPIVLQFWPSNWPSRLMPEGPDPKQAFRKTALAQREWAPILRVGRQQFTQFAIRDTGEIVDAKGQDPVAKLGSGAAGGLAALNDLFGSAGSQNERPPTDKRILTAVWIEYEMRAPGASTRTIRRQVFDLLGPAARASKPAPKPGLDDPRILTRNLALMMETELLPVVCRIDPAFVTHLTAQGVLANRDMLAALVRGDDMTDSQLPEFARRVVPMPSPLYALATARFAESGVADQIYVDRPDILTRHVSLTPAAQTFRLRAATDIVANEIGVDLLARDAFMVRLEQGVFDTNAESLVQAGARGEGTAEAFAAGGAWVTLRSIGDPKLAALDLADDDRRRVAQDLAAGYVVVASAGLSSSGSATHVSWWRVDPASGQTLGIGSNGWGQGVVEFAIIVAEGMALSWLFTYFLCQMQTPAGPVARACDPAVSPRLRLPFMDLLVVPVAAAGDSICVRQAYLSMLLAGLLAQLGMVFANSPPLFGNGGGPPSAPGTAPAVDPFGETAPASPGEGSPGGGPGGGGPGGGGPGGAAGGGAAGGGAAGSGAAGGGGAGGGASSSGPPSVDPSAPTQRSPMSPELQQAEDAFVQAVQDMLQAEQALVDSLNGDFQSAYANFTNARNQLFEARDALIRAQMVGGATAPSSPVSPGAHSVGPGGGPVSPGAGSVPPGPSSGAPGPPPSPPTRTLAGLGGVSNVLTSTGKQ